MEDVISQGTSGRSEIAKTESESQMQFTRNKQVLVTVLAYGTVYN